MLVTTSDDFSIKIWRSRAALETLLGVEPTNAFSRAIPGQHRNPRSNLKKCVTL